MKTKCLEKNIIQKYTFRNVLLQAESRYGMRDYLALVMTRPIGGIGLFPALLSG